MHGGNSPPQSSHPFCNHSSHKPLTHLFPPLRPPTSLHPPPLPPTTQKRTPTHLQSSSTHGWLRDEWVIMTLMAPILVGGWCTPINNTLRPASWQCLANSFVQVLSFSYNHVLQGVEWWV